MIMRKTVTAVAVFVFTLALNGCGIAGSASLLTQEELSSQSDENAGTDTQEPESEAESDRICVYVCGAVEEPGVYYFPENSRVCEAITMAGGFAEDAATEYLNQAELLTDAQRLYVPTLEESYALEGQGTGGVDAYAGITAEGLVNINYATEEELMTVSGIGETRAAAIVAYRRENGLFSSTDQIVNVSGIGDSTYEKIKSYITVN